ncbi:MAG: dTDP-4-dehydrorhamnose 3,5-epimerase [Melioribacteraceae bacterium]|nr:dTDP-4-dehydrorhamnose 3,5-epimerase [Melioribacteraceae bacterium]
MYLTTTNISDVKLIIPKVHSDDRGYFFESFRQDLFEREIGKINFVQDNESKSTFGVLRGLHYQLPPFAQSKLVRVIKGKVLDIAVDIRKSSKYFGQYVAVELSEENKLQMFIPQGFAHAYLVLSDEAIFQYKVDNYYSPQHDRGIIYNDPEININLPIDDSKLIISNKDKNLIALKDAELFK